MDLTPAPSGPSGPGQDVAGLRRAYNRAGLAEADLAPDPVTQLGRWLAEAVAAGLTEPNAMVLSTVSVEGWPSSRVVLLKGYDERGLTLYTNRTSRKGRQALATGRAAVTVPWLDLERQVGVVGTVGPVDDAESDAYFATRPRGSQLGAWVSHQSRVIASRDVLDRRLAEVAGRWPVGAAVPRPPFWGGLRVVPVEVEFWQGRPDRLHDRLRYRRSPGSPAGWVVERLSP